MPRIVLCPQVYPPETHPTAVMAEQLARYLVARGWSVHVSVGLPHHPQGRLYPGHPWQLRAREDDDGITVLRHGHLVHASRSIAVRSAVLASQALAAGLGTLAAGSVDVVLVIGPPLLGPLVGGAVARWRHAKFVNVVYDIYPDVAQETGKVRNPALLAAARVAERLQYRLTDHTLVLSQGFKQTLVARGVPEHRISVVPVWLAPDEIRPGPRANPWRAEHAIPEDRFVVLYAGTIGVVSGAEFVADAALQLRDRRDILFLFVGDGEARAPTEHRVRQFGLDNVRFLPLQPRSRLAEVQATADVGLVTLAPGRGRTSVPSKVVGYLAAGRPVLASVDPDSDTAREVRDSGAGVVCPPGSPTALAAAVRSLADDAAGLPDLGRRARRWFEQRFARDAVLERFEAVLTAVVDTAP